MATCIYCPEAAASKEHWLPRGFGAIREMTLLQDRVCEECNNALGREVDQDLVRTGPTGLLRSLLQIEGRNGPSPNPFYYKVMGPVSATTMTMPSPDRSYEILAEPYQDRDGTAHARPLRQLVFRKADGRVECVPFPPAYDGQRLAALLKCRGVEGSELFEVYLGPDEGPDSVDFKRVLKDAVGKFDVLAHYGSGTSERAEVRLSAGISLAYLRAAAKVAFHYYLWTSDVHTGAEVLFQPIRQFIRHGDGDWRSFVRLTTPQFIQQLAEGEVPECFSHFFWAGKSHGMLIGIVQFFVGPDHVTPPSVVMLGITSKRVIPRCHWVSYYGEKIGSYDGEITEVTERRGAAPDHISGG